VERIYRSLLLLSDDELIHASITLRGKVMSHPVMNTDLRCEAFALVKEAVRRSLGFTMYDVQLSGGWLMCDGHAIEMKTGEGKTIVALLPAYWFGLHRDSVHIITVNEYLARRDCEQMSAVFRLLDVSVGLNLANMSLQNKKIAYQQKITFGTATEFGFDYLRDHMAYEAESKVQRKLTLAIIDEIDSILLDEARTPLMIAHKIPAAPDTYTICTKFIAAFQEMRDYEIDLETKQVMFSESAIHKIETAFFIDNLYDPECAPVYHCLLQCLRAKVLFCRDIDYIIRDEKVRLIDAFTGRIMEGRQFQDGLHQAIEAKEQLLLSEENHLHAIITIQKYFSLYDQLTGLTGTAKMDEAEFKQIYNLQIVAVPTQQPVIRVDKPDRVFRSKQEKHQQIVAVIQQCYLSGQPVLVGTTSVRQSEEIAGLLTQASIPHQLLNAKTQRDEANMIAMAGQYGAITIATNMAGRGTDICLGSGVAEIGGLYVIGTERHESRRIDQQLRGRSGRQGDPGTSQFLLSLEDEWLKRYADEEAHNYQQLWAIDKKGSTHQKKLLNFMDKVIIHVEQQMHSIRTLVYEFDTVFHEQRQSFYHMRDVIMDEQDKSANLLALYCEHCIERLLDEICPQKIIPEKWDIKKLAMLLRMSGNEWISLAKYREPDQMRSFIMQWWHHRHHHYMNLIEDTQDWINRWRLQLLQTMDHYWMKHLEYADQLKQGIHYQSYGGKNPVDYYGSTTWRQFQEMNRQIEHSLGSMFINEAGRFQVDEPISQSS